MTHEFPPPFSDPRINPEDRTSATYPYAGIAMSAPPNENIVVLTATVNHPTDPDPKAPGGWQYKPLLDIVTSTVRPLSEAPWTVLIEGNLDKRLEVIKAEMNPEEAFRYESDCGVFLLEGLRKKQTVESWDIAGAKEFEKYMGMYINPASPLANDLREAWKSPSEFAEWIYCLMYARLYVIQWLRHYQGGTYLGDPDSYTKARLEALGVPKTVEKYRKQFQSPINTSKERLAEIHEQVRKEAKLANPLLRTLPFDPFEADAQGLKPEDYEIAYYAPMGTSPYNLAGYSRMQRLGSTGYIRDEGMADAVSSRLKTGNVSGVGGGLHAASAMKIMYERGDLLAGSLKWHIGAAACSMAFS